MFVINGKTCRFPSKTFYGAFDYSESFTDLIFDCSESFTDLRLDATIHLSSILPVAAADDGAGEGADPHEADQEGAARTVAG